MLTLETPLSESHLPTLTTRALTRLAEGLGIATVRDLLWHLPLRYETRGAVSAIGELREGAAVTIVGTVLQQRVGRTMRKKLRFAETTVADPTGKLSVVWFHQPWMAERLRQGDRVMLSGKISKSAGRTYLANPGYEILARGIRGGEEAFALIPPPAEAASLIPIYPETEGVTSRWLQYLAGEAMNRLGAVADEFPKSVRERENLQPVDVTLRNVHAPSRREEAERARRELLFRELFLLQCAVLLARAHREAQRAFTVKLDAPLIQDFLPSLPFTLTQSQRVAAYEILRDMELPRPMHRLLVGDVGSGKTVVAAIAALNAVKSAKGQTALMAPTEILAKQHFATFATMLAPLKVRIALLTGSESRVTPKRVQSERAIHTSKPKLFAEIASGNIDILIGTHALISGPRRGRPNRLKPTGALRFKKLLLAIIDEQHRFGVLQRKRMEEAEQVFRGAQASAPHLLTLTATPIPRTLALTIFGDLDLSLLKEVPHDRRGVETIILTPRQEERAFVRVRGEVEKGHQAFIICPLVSRSEKIEAKAAEEEFSRMKTGVFPELSLGLLHGRMKSDQKERVMREFSRGKIDVLIATPVVEVGIDIPNATVMLVEGAERFGLAQLHQFRGRVGRSDLPSFCFFIAHDRGSVVRKRLEAVAKAESGSDVAAADLKLRGPGELLGVAQSGVPDTTMQAIGDLTLITRARSAARDFLLAGGLRTAPVLARRIAQVKTKLHLS